MSDTVPPKKPNPAFEHVMWGLPKFKAKLPSKPWLVFIGLAATWTGLVVHDRREKKRLQSYWCDRVSHLATKPMPPTQMPRKITIYLSAPPGDGITSAREYFKEYVKPVLVAGAVDYEVIEGRKTGEIRWKVAQRTRRIRNGGDDSEGSDKETAIRNTAAQAGITREDGPGGIVVVGRHTWKEYIRGLHEGWLGLPEVPDPEGPAATGKPAQEASPIVSSISDALPTDASTDDSQPPVGEPDKASTETAQVDAEKKPKKPHFPPATISQDEYESSVLPGSIPPSFQPSKVLPFPHLLGFLNTPFRIQRYLTQRRLMDHVCREVASVALGISEPYENGEDVTAAYTIEEADWPRKWVTRLKEGNWEDDKDELARESTVVQELSSDRRIVERMKKFVLPREDDVDMSSLD